MTRRRFAKCVPSAARKSRGAALTECFFLTIILVPLLFGTAMLGKLIDVRQTAVQASRYVAWESTVDGSAHGGADVSARFFGDRSGAIGSGSPGGVSDAAAGTNALWGERPRADSGILEDTRVTVDAEGVMRTDDGTLEGPTMARGMGGVVVRAGSALGIASAGEWDLEADGFLRRGVTVPVEGNGWFARRLGNCGSEGAYACLTELSVIMTDDWSAGDDDEAEKRIKSLVPAGALRGVANLLAVAGQLPILEELEGLSGALGKVDVTALPSTEIGERILGDYPEGDTP